MSGVGALYAAREHLPGRTAHSPTPAGADRSARAARRSPPGATGSRPAAARDSFRPPRPRSGAATEVDVGGFGLAAFEVASARGPPHRHRLGRRAARANSSTAAHAERYARRGAIRHAARAIARAPPQPGHRCRTPRTADAYEPGARELQSALGVLQVRSPPTIMLGGKVVQRTIAQLRQDLLNQLRHATPAGQTPRLDDEDADTIELVGLLFRTAHAGDARERPHAVAADAAAGADAARGVARQGLFLQRRSSGAAPAQLDRRNRHALDRRRRRIRPDADRAHAARDRARQPEFDTDLRLFEQINDDLHDARAVAGAQGRCLRTPPGRGVPRAREAGAGARHGGARHRDPAGVATSRAACCARCSSRPGPTCSR